MKLYIFTLVVLVSVSLVNAQYNVTKLADNVTKLQNMSLTHNVTYDSPPKNIAVERPSGMYSYGESGVVMDDRQPTVLKCTAEGIPEPSFTWKFNNQEMSSNASIENGVLTINKPTVADEGIYQCVASNPLGTALSTKYNVQLAYQDTFSDASPVKEQFIEGEDALILCGAPAGAPPPAIYWSNDESTTELQVDQRISYTSEGDLYFANIIKSDERNYYCFAGNMLLGKFMRSPSRIVVVADGTGEVIPALITHFPGARVEGLRTQKFEMVCLASGFPTPTIRWLRGDTVINSPKITFNSLSFEDAGNYICSASNDESSLPNERTVFLHVASLPYFETKPSDITLAPGQSGQIDCDVGGMPEPVITWLQNGQPPRDSESGLYNIQDTGISIYEPREGDSTVFQCIAKNIHGELLGSYTVTILAIPATLSEQPRRHLLLAEESTLTLRCVAFGSPIPRIEWYFNNDMLNTSSRITMVEEKGDVATNNTLTIVDIVTEDGGNYECHAINTVGESTASTMVSVKLPTSVEVVLERSVINRDETATFTCEVVKDRRSVATVTWLFQDELITRINEGGSRFAATRHLKQLQVMNALITDTGYYTCVASTDYDSSNNTVELTVQDRPSKPYNLDLIMVGLHAALNWVPGADNNADIQSYTIQYRTQHATFPEESAIAPWKEVRTVSASETSDGVELGNYLKYSFRVLATNVVGPSSPSDVKEGSMTDPAPPDESSMPDNMRSQATAPGTLTIRWDEVHPYYHKGPNFTYVIRWKEEGEDTWHEEVLNSTETSFDINTDGYNNIEYSVGVDNSEGGGPESALKEASTGEGTPLAAPGNVQLKAISPNEINVTWDAVPKEDLNGLARSYRIFYTMQAAQGSEKYQDCSANMTDCILGGLEAFTFYEISVAVVNGHNIGPRSAQQTIKTAEGVPSAPAITASKHTSYRISLAWNAPDSSNGILLGYNLSIAQYDGNNIKNWYYKTMDSPDAKSYQHAATPSTSYEVILTAYTEVGESDPSKVDITTNPAGAPVDPAKVLSEHGPKSANLTWDATDSDGPLPDEIKACYRFKGETAENCTKQYDALTTDNIAIAPLQEGREYEVYLVFTNKDGTTDGPITTFTTTGSGESGNSGGSLTPWFIAIICIIIFLLLILLIICILKSQKGGKYNVSDKEKQLKDPENAPLKDNGGFPEYNNDTEFPDEGSQDSLDSRPDGSEGDSLKEYADDEDTGKFNEEGSFIEEYHDPKTRSSDIQGGTSTFV